MMRTPIQNIEMPLASFSKKILEPISKNITGFYTTNLDQCSIDRSEQLMKYLQEELDRQIQELEKLKITNKCSQ